MTPSKEIFFKTVTKSTDDKGEGNNKKEETITTLKLRTLFTKDIMKREWKDKWQGWRRRYSQLTDKTLSKPQ